MSERADPLRDPRRGWTPTCCPVVCKERGEQSESINLLEGPDATSTWHVLREAPPEIGRE